MRLIPPELAAKIAKKLGIIIPVQHTHKKQSAAIDNQKEDSSSDDNLLDDDDIQLDGNRTYVMDEQNIPPPPALPRQDAVPPRIPDGPVENANQQHPRPQLAQNIDNPRRLALYEDIQERPQRPQRSRQQPRWMEDYVMLGLHQKRRASV